MKLTQVEKVMETVEAFCERRAHMVEVGDVIGEDRQAIETLFIMTGMADCTGYAKAGVEPWRVIGTITLMYMLRTNRALSGVVVGPKKRKEGEG